MLVVVLLLGALLLHLPEQGLDRGLPLLLLVGEGDQGLHHWRRCRLRFRLLLELCEECAEVIVGGTVLVEGIYSHLWRILRW